MITGFICALIIVGGSIGDIAQAPVFSITIVVLLAFAVGSAFMDVWVRSQKLIALQLIALQFAAVVLPGYFECCDAFSLTNMCFFAGDGSRDHLSMV